MAPDVALTFLAWGSLLAVLYVYVLYPVLLWQLSTWFGRDPTPPSTDAAELPLLSLLIAAHNEQGVIADRLENALATRYPPDRVEIVVASDGSSDRTDDIVRGFQHRGVRLLGDGVRRGKTGTIAWAVPSLRGSVVVLSDANTHMDPNALVRLARWFADPRVGVVCGRLILIDAVTGRNVDGLYWRYEQFLRRWEARLDALLGANGAIYAMRRTALVPCPPDTLVDDLVLPLLARLKSGVRIVLDTDATATEETPRHISAEFGRRARIGAGDFQSIGLLWPLLNPRRGWIALSFVSHKLLRWYCPFFLLALLGATLALRSRFPYNVMFSGQVVFYLVALVGWFMPGVGAASRGVRLVTLFVTVNIALAMGFLRWLFGSRHGTWQRTAR